MLSQSIALNAIFGELARRAALNMGEHLSATESYMRLALKAQGQCRATLETLANIKNPHPVAFVQEANIAHGPQQVNNGIAPSQGAPAQATKNAFEPNELLEQQHGERLDTRPQGTASRDDPQVVPVAAQHRPANT